MRSEGVHTEVLRQIERLGGTLPGTVDAGVHWTDAPRPLPPEIETLMAITWPPRTLLVTAEYGDRVSFPQGISGGDPFGVDRPCFVIGFNESTQCYWVVDLDDPRPGDPGVHRIDHDGSDVEDAFGHPRRLSRMLAELAVYAPPDSARLANACAYGELETLATAIAAGVPLGPAEDDRSAMTPLHFAVMSGSAGTVQMLLAAGADTGARTRHDSLLTELGLHPADFGMERIERKVTPLWMAVRGPFRTDRPGPSVEVVRALLDAGADPRATDRRGRTPLHVVAESRLPYERERPVAERLEILRCLIDAGADVEAEDRLGLTPLLVAVDAPEFVAALLDAGADPARRTAHKDLFGIKGVSALHAAASDSHQEVLRLMLERTGDPDPRTTAGATPLHCAVWREAGTGVVETLIAAGADVNARIADPSGLRVDSDTPLGIARERGRDKIVEVLTRAGAA
ncbi:MULTISPECIES: ankyrin repeat domain-containing protein [Streptomyces]|uniref:Ankyrin repeat domain-containing protein n=1 Tax=Streptomyces lonegramiae TaxID=3075524 RepID=A0ABU2X8J3_9ACTN|nr:ankyrin repeat domain-containing protein [Streptomyces sp. DSM 41529]MDT0541273.1 ankyrin repeat domain-containing protein [Streptomyces sp. DSM 41529]